MKEYEIFRTPRSLFDNNECFLKSVKGQRAKTNEALRVTVVRQRQSPQTLRVFIPKLRCGQSPVAKTRFTVISRARC